jgi:hypothetical protein
MKILHLGSVPLCLTALCLISCEPDDDRTEILYQTTINVLENQTLPYMLDEGDRIAGFYLGFDLNDRPLNQSASYTLSEQRLNGAGSEFGICNDGEKYNFGIGSTLLNFIQVIGDTGAEDVSDDGDCGCDTRINVIEFYGLDVLFESGDHIAFSPSRLEGNTLMCPNIPAGHLINGDRDFGGPVKVDASITLRVSEDRRALLADITYHVVEDN